MEPQIEIVSSVQVNWPRVRGLVSKLVALEPSQKVSESSIEFSEAAEWLLFAAYMLEGDTVKEPYELLCNLPVQSMQYLHYTFIIGCNNETLTWLQETTNGNYAVQKALEDTYCTLATGSFLTWYNAIWLNLMGEPYSLNACLLFNKMLLLFEREGLQAVFSKYKKQTLKDGTFLLR